MEMRKRLHNLCVWGSAEVPRRISADIHLPRHEGTLSKRRFAVLVAGRRWVELDQTTATRFVMQPRLVHCHCESVHVDMHTAAPEEVPQEKTKLHPRYFEEQMSNLAPASCGVGNRRYCRNRCKDR